MKIRNHGILTSISWNTNKWAAPANENDLEASNFGHVKEHNWMHEDLNFGHNIYPPEEDGEYIAYTPMFNRLPSTVGSKYVDVVFFRSFNPSKKATFIVGMYAYPKIDDFDREANHDAFNYYNSGNVKSKVENISLFTNPLEISNNNCHLKGYLPSGKKLGKQGFNYLAKQNVIKLLDDLGSINPKDTVITKLKRDLITNK